MLQACDELGNKYAEAHKGGGVGVGGEPRQSRGSQRPSLDYKSLSVSIAELAESV